MFLLLFLGLPSAAFLLPRCPRILATSDSATGQPEVITCKPLWKTLRKLRVQFLPWPSTPLLLPRCPRVLATSDSDA